MKKITYRDHKGSLKESMLTSREFTNIHQLKDHLSAEWPYNSDAKIAEIKFKHLGEDLRTGWNTNAVLIRIEGQEGFVVAGMSDGVLPLENEDKPESELISKMPELGCIDFFLDPQDFNILCALLNLGFRVTEWHQSGTTGWREAEGNVTAMLFNNHTSAHMSIKFKIGGEFKTRPLAAIIKSTKISGGSATIFGKEY